MGYEIKIGNFSITLDDNASAVAAPNMRMAAMFKGMSTAIGNMRTAAQLAEHECEALEKIRSDPDLTDAAKTRRRKEVVNPDTLRDFQKGAATVSGQASDILSFLKRELLPVDPLKTDDVQGYLRDSEMRTVFRSFDGSVKNRLLSAMHRGEQPDLCNAILRANPLCSDLTTDQIARLALSRISSENTPVVQAVSELVIATRKDLRQLTAIRAWYTNLVFGSNYDPDQMEMRVTGLDNLAEYVETMLCINQRQGALNPSEKAESETLNNSPSGE